MRKLTLSLFMLCAWALAAHGETAMTLSLASAMSQQMDLAETEQSYVTEREFYRQEIMLPAPVNKNGQQGSLNTVPEPAALALIGTAIGGAFFYRMPTRRRIM